MKSTNAPPEKPETPGLLREDRGAPEWPGHQETLRLEPWGPDAVRGGTLRHDLPGARHYTPTGNGYHRLEQRFAAYEGERLCGLGQHQHGLLDQKGATVVAAPLDRIPLFLRDDADLPILPTG